MIYDIANVFPLSNKVKIQKNIESFMLSQKYLFPLGIIINELITNSMKHAFMEISNPYLKVSLTRNEKIIKLSVEDNGKGISDEKISDSSGFGISLVKLIAEQLKADFVVERNNGSRFIFQFKYE